MSHLYAHFTSREAAESIAAEHRLLPCTYLGDARTSYVYAVEVGVSHHVPSVQHDRNGCRDYAVIFEAIRPNEISEFGEEVVWYTRTEDGGALIIRDAMVVPAEEVVATLVHGGDRPPMPTPI